MTASLSPDRILQTGTAFWGSKALLSAVELGLFTALADGPRTGEELRRQLGLHPRAVPDFLDTLLALGFLRREGRGEQAAYSNTPETQHFLDRGSPAYIGGMLEMANARLYPFWGDLTEALRTGQPQNEIKHSGEPMFAKLYEDPARLEQFMAAMSGISAGNFSLLAQKFDFGPYRTLADIGGATGQLSCIVAARHPHLRCTTLDLPEVSVIAGRHIERRGLAARVQARPLDFFRDDFPQADVITMGMILHDWNLEKKLQLMRKAYAALPAGGCLIAVDNLIDDERRHNAFGLLMSLNMLIEFGDAFDYTGADFAGWAREVGFTRTEVIPLAGPGSAAVAYK
ncbi:methyltransferase [Azohydromonas caseinilytica]|uniref:Methyltransferase n=1 Tax=Azohydromonas caseinilytica TaxID=2728836 RepID=A0A848FHU1_9BURK|nr:methyltransferase [Azohydromonas caseinilytica]NML18716.1 methyltransferase [Azohydromonas caseinilytica]